MTDIAKLLGSREGEREFERAMAGNIRAGNFGPICDYILKALSHYGSPFATLCKATTSNTVTLSGWEIIWKDIVKYSGQSQKCTALGIDLTGHYDGPEPGFEISYYNQSEFTTVGRDALLAECESYGTFWQGGFMDCGWGLDVAGLAPLYAMIRATDVSHHYYGKGDAGPDFIGFTLAQWYLYAIVHEVIARDIRRLGLPAAMPVIISEHDFGPWIGNVIMCETIANHGLTSQGIAAIERASNIAARSEVTEKNIAEFTEQRNLIRSWGRFGHNKGQKTYIRFCESAFNMKMVCTDLAKSPVPWKQSDGNYTRFLEQYRAMRAARYKQAS
ncbi:hypothetical protein [Fretibacter rubidus]|uniref:hypothetical protein n=1 Tax=Fretibacter rubidus TaxID=570162 RepID=UPI00352B61AF